MLIKSKDNKSIIGNLSLYKNYFFIFIFVAISILGGFIYGYVGYRDGLRLRQIIEPYFNAITYSIKNPTILLTNYISGKLSNPDRLLLDIKFEDYEKLALKRNEALRLNRLNRSSNDWVDGQIEYNSKKYKAKLRLKGVASDHWYDDNWSFAVKLKKDNTLFGMKKFDLQHPRTRNYLNEWYYQELLRYNNLISLRYHFIDLSINGVDKPIYAIEEGIDKLLIENNKQREGLIFRINQPSNLKVEEQKGELFVYNEKKVLNQPLYRKYLLFIRSQLQDLLDGEKNFSDVFDRKKFADLFALVDLFGTNHPVQLPNIRFYYNPLTALIEPIATDNQRFLKTNILYGFSADVIDTPNNDSKMKFYYEIFMPKNLFKDLKLFDSYIQSLEKFSDNNYLTKFNSTIEQKLLKNIKILNKSFPYYEFDNEILYKNQEMIRTHLSLERDKVKFYFNNIDYKKNELSFYVKNEVGLPVLLHDIKINKKSIYSDMTPLVFQSSNDIIDSEFLKINLGEHIEINDNEISQMVVEYGLLGLQNIFSSKFQTMSLPDKNLTFNEKGLTSKIDDIIKMDFIEFDELKKEIKIKAGEWDIYEEVIIPRGYVLTATSNTKINLFNQSFILSYSPIKFIAKNNSPIIIDSFNKDGKGLSIINADSISHLKHVKIYNQTNLNKYGWNFTGAVNFFNSNVNLDSCYFSSNISEDALNIIRSVFDINHLTFQNSFSDALDLDFCEGEINNSFFFNSNNDAVDCSGSDIFAENIYINNAGDKGVSIGEKSIFNGKNLEITNSNVAIASKDLSIVNLDKVSISDTNHGFAAYQKKPEFGYGKILCRNINFKNVKSIHFIENGSYLAINDEIIHGDKKNDLF